MAWQSGSKENTFHPHTGIKERRRKKRSRREKRENRKWGQDTKPIPSDKLPPVRFYLLQAP